MKRYNRTLDGFFATLKYTAERIELEYKLSLVIDIGKSEECFHCVVREVSNIGIDQIDAYSFASQSAYWVKHIKPIRLGAYDFDHLDTYEAALRDYADEIGVTKKQVSDLIDFARSQAVPEPLDNDKQGGVDEMFINERLAIRFAFRLLSNEDIYLLFKPHQIEQMVEDMRYKFHWGSPDSVRQVLLAMDPPELDPRPTKRLHDQRNDSNSET